MERRVPARLTPAEGRKFGLLVGGAFIVLGLLLWYRGHSTAAWIVVPLGALLIAAGLIAPARLGPVYRGWNALALAISKVTTPIFMGVIYFLVLTPTGLLARLLGHRPLSRTRGEPTHWQSRPIGGTRGAMNHQF